ncbi:MAG TPA: electron transfer flavoprotein-ubiquinone oxidoreductase [Sulfuricaulis sp.]|nr:electron transfer flavoprotein-ubiquinone oxidoreductase [Sulfuricaulis sp.]
MPSPPREQLETPVLIVGAGPAGLSCALRLSQLLRQADTGLGPGDIYVIEKAESIGMHTLSGAVFDPTALRELLPEYAAAGAPLGVPVADEHLLLLSRRRAFSVPWAARLQGNHGCHVLSLGKLTQWLAQRTEAEGVNVLTGLPGAELLIENNTVTGVRTGDRGHGRSGEPGPDFEPGADLRARVTILAEGARGSLGRQLIERFALDAQSNPPLYSLGMKELWEIPSGRIAPGTIWHTLGHPLPPSMYGGGWLYALGDNRVSLGLMVGLHYTDPRFEPHTALQQLKLHPRLRRVLDGGRLLRYGAKTLSTGGYWSLPRGHAPGALLIGDAAGFVDTRRLKGIHLAMKTGMLAAESAFAALSSGSQAPLVLADFDERVRTSWAGKQMWTARNFHQGFEHGLVSGIAQAMLQLVSGGRGLRRRTRNLPGHEYLRQVRKTAGSPAPEADGHLTFDRATSVYHSATRHDEQQPPHLLVHDTAICVSRCAAEFGNPCTRFCPAGVYEWAASEDGGTLKLNPSNCLHCKACDIMDPYRNITWVPPEGDGGPRYEGM